MSITVSPEPNTSVDSNNSTTTPLTAGATFTGTATNVLGYQQQGITMLIAPSTAKCSFYFEYSDDATNWDISVPHFISVPAVFIPVSPITVKKWFRVKVINDGGTSAISALGLTDTAGTPTSQTTFRLTTLLYPKATKELARTLDQSVTGSDPVNLVRSVGMGKSTDNTYQNFRADGISTGNSSASTLGSGIAFTGIAFDAKGYAAYSVLVKSNVDSAASGVAVQFSDTSSFTDTRAEDTYTYTSSSGVRFAGAIKARYIRIVYTNGGTGQSSFFLETTLSTVPAQVPISTPESTFSSSTNIVTGRNVIVAKNPSGTYGNVLRGDNGGLRVDIDALTGTPKMTQEAVTASATQFLSTPLSGRRSIMFVAPTSNTKIIAVGLTAGITLTTGSVPLGPGASIVFDLDDTYNTWYHISESGTQRIAVVELS